MPSVFSASRQFLLRCFSPVTLDALGGRAVYPKVLLTSGQTLEGGFYKHETIHDVYAFLQSSVVNGGCVRACVRRERVFRFSSGVSLSTRE